MAEILVNKGKAEFIEEPEVSTVEVIEDEPVVETVEEPEIDSVEMDEETIVETIKQHPTVTEKIISPIEKPVKKQKAIIQNKEPKVRKKRTVKVKK
jgi:hypothetical protein